MATNRRIVILLVSALLCWLAAGCSSSKSNQTSTTLHFTLPTSGPTVELSPAGIATVNLAVNQSVNSEPHQHAGGDRDYVLVIPGKPSGSASSSPWADLLRTRFPAL